MTLWYHGLPKSREELKSYLHHSAYGHQTWQGGDFLKGLLPINPFHASGLLRYPKETENLWFSDVFREYRKRPVA